MKSRLDLLRSLFDDFHQEWGLAVSSRDFEYLERRYKEEGYPFLAATLPELDDLLLDGLSRSCLRHSRWARSCSDPRPKFLKGLWDEVFDQDGTLRNQPCITSIRAIRQTSRLFKKVFEVCEDKYVETAIEQFVQTDQELPLSVPFVDEISRVNAVLHGRFLYEIAHCDDLVGSHGPGATAERLDSVARWNFPTISRSIANWFDIGDFFPRYTEDWPRSLVDPIGRVIPVPKTFTKPRLISIEPAASMFAQKALLRLLDQHMSCIPQLNMRDQSRNMDLARRASIDGSISTIDLSEASDRVSLALFEAIFKRTPSFRNFAMDMRTAAVDVNGSILLLRKYASMGCALTFPIQMLVFRTIIIWAMCLQDGDLSLKNIKAHSRSRDVGVYGDDIIIPTPYAQSVMRALEVFGLKVNSSKSYATGFFRESCGGDFFKGIPVKPVYVRKQPPHNRHDVEGLLSWASLAKLLQDRDCPRAARFASNLVQDIIGPLPYGEQSEDAYSFRYERDCYPLVQETLSVPFPRACKERYNRALQRHEVLGAVPSPRRRRVRADEESTLSHALRSAGSDEIDPLRLTHHGRPTSAFISRRWITAH